MTTFLEEIAVKYGIVKKAIYSRRKMVNCSLYSNHDTNPRWDEVLAALQPGQRAHERYDIVSRVFHLKLTALMSDIKSGCFGPCIGYNQFFPINSSFNWLNNCTFLWITAFHLLLYENMNVSFSVYYICLWQQVLSSGMPDGTFTTVVLQFLLKKTELIYAVEWQKRGLPHAHILVFLAPGAKLQHPDEYDRVVCAEIPDEETHPVLHRLVIEFMVHGHTCFDLKKLSDKSLFFSFFTAVCVYFYDQFFQCFFRHAVRREEGNIHSTFWRVFIKQ